MTGDQQFWLGMATQIVILIGVIITYLKGHETARKADRNGEQVKALEVKVDGRLSQLLAAAERAARAEGIVEGVATTSAPTIVPVVVPAASGQSAPGKSGRRATDPPVPADPGHHEGPERVEE